MMVSICMITYNHEKYLKQAIDGVLGQKTNFEIELVIANDNSPDNTDAIIQEYIKSNPNGNKIKYIHNRVNIGMMPNFINALKNCTGKYVAMCEGDDYWTDEFKLQKQVDFLEENKEYAICFHKVDVETNGVVNEDSITLDSPNRTTIKDLANGNYIHTCSVIYRNHLFKRLPRYFKKAPIGDYYLHLLNSIHGDIYRMDDKMAVYRVHDTSYWSSKQQEDRTKIWVTFLKKMKSNFPKEVRKILIEQILRLEPPQESKSKQIKKKIRGYKRKIIGFFFKRKNKN